MALPPLTPRYIDSITARKQDGVTGFFSKDLHGDVRYAFNSAGTEIANYVYDAWGDERTNDDAAWEINNPVRYNGQYLDEETGMYYLRARYYAPEVSRFISEDPHWNVGNMIYGDSGNNYPDSLSVIQSSNLYSYCINNPIKYSDIMGRAIESNDLYLLRIGVMPLRDFRLLEAYTKAYERAEMVNDYRTMNMMRKNAVEIRDKYTHGYEDNDRYDYTHGGRTDKNGNIIRKKTNTSSTSQKKAKNGTGLSIDSDYSNDHSDFTSIKDTFDRVFSGNAGGGATGGSVTPEPIDVSLDSCIMHGGPKVTPRPDNLE